ncbi:class I adenylate-forming enzyme family protein [Desulfoferula mesophila]|uniref:ATP-dependent acyl-CoA ligase n=1 Tax=Desulfoferula mesophila TaxID=3058419 RepID=A0AAU9E9G8_9BACT|nr:ATP-dependent acyl-CoA ligase [Desulfoferula mesophilus]
MNLAQLWQKQAAQYGDKTFLYFGDDEYSYNQMLGTFYRVADSLAGLGVAKGDRVALMHRNAPEFLYTWFALSFLGAITVPINPVFTETEIAYILGHSGAKALVIEQEFLETLGKVSREQTPELGQVIVSGGQAPEGTIPFARLMLGAERDPGVAIDDQDPCVCIYTSGTTDMPKGVLNSHYGWVTTGQAYVYTVGIGENDRVMTPNPLFHANAQVYSTMGSLNAGAGLILLERFSGSQILEQARRYQATKMVLVQAVTPWVWGRPVSADDCEHNLDTMVAGNVPVDIYEKFEERFCLKIQTIYSLTEATMAVMGPRPGTMPRKPGSIGVPMEHPDPAVTNRVWIADEAGRELPAGKQGEIIINNPAVMLGYYNDPAKTAATKIDGWVHTGDIGFRDEEGYIFFVGRKKEVIRRRGELISPTQIEAVLNAHPAVAESAVIGVPSELGTGEEEVKAFVRLEEGGQATAEELQEFCRAKLAEFKVPRFIEFRSEFAKSAIGRIKKEELKKSNP